MAMPDNPSVRTATVILDEIAEKKAILEGVNREIGRLFSELKAIRAQQYGLSEGVLLSAKNKVYKFASADDFMIEYPRKPWVLGYVQRKDGTFSQAITKLYDYWTVVQ